MKIIYLLVLFAGSALAAYGLIDTVPRLGVEAMAASVDTGGTCLALLVASVFHAYLYVRGRSRWSALVIYVVSYPVIAVFYSVLLRSMMKGFAPAEVTSTDYLVAVLILVIVLALPMFVLSRTKPTSAVGSKAN